jgi:hypothetical protein
VPELLPPLPPPLPIGALSNPAAVPATPPSQWGGDPSSAELNAASAHATAGCWCLPRKVSVLPLLFCRLYWEDFGEVGSPDSSCEVSRDWGALNCASALRALFVHDKGLV